MDIHVHPHQQLHEGTFAMDAYLFATDDLDQLLLTVNGAADRVHTSVVSISTCGQKVGDHQQVMQARIRITLKITKKHNYYFTSSINYCAYFSCEYLPSQVASSFSEQVLAPVTLIITNQTDEPHHF